MKETIDNFLEIENFMTFKEGSFYKFELLARNTDSDTNVVLLDPYTDGKPKNFNIKEWYVDSLEYYHKVKHEMKGLAELTGTRLYMVLDRKDKRKLGINAIRSLIDITYEFPENSRKVFKVIDSESSKKEASEHDLRTVMWDVDIKESIIVEALDDYIISKGLKSYIIESKKGFHVFCYKKFNTSNWEQEVIDTYRKVHKEARLNSMVQLTHLVHDFATLKDNAMCLVYQTYEIE